MEGINILGLLLGYLALLIVVVCLLAAFIVLLIGKYQAARIVCGAGWFAGSILGTIAVLTCISFEGTRDPSVGFTAATAAMIFAAGFGPFLASLRSGRAFAASLGCALGMYAVLALPGSEGDWTLAVAEHAALERWLPMRLAFPMAIVLCLASLAFGVLSLRKRAREPFPESQAIMRR